jgi:hypothetical protein
MYACWLKFSARNRRMMAGMSRTEPHGVIASYDEFTVEHRAGHLNPFNNWCAFVENSLAVVGAVAMLSGRRKAGLALVGAGTAVGGVGHVVEGNLLQAVREVARHPIWSVRADFGVALATIMGKPIH